MELVDDNVNPCKNALTNGCWLGSSLDMAICSASSSYFEDQLANASDIQVSYWCYSPLLVWQFTIARLGQHVSTAALIHLVESICRHHPSTSFPTISHNEEIALCRLYLSIWKGISKPERMRHLSSIIRGMWTEQLWRLFSTCNSNYPLLQSMLNKRSISTRYVQNLL